MRKLLARGLVIIIEASLFMLADLITKRRKGNGLHRGRPDDNLRCHPIGAGYSQHSWLRRGRRRRRFIF